MESLFKFCCGWLKISFELKDKVFLFWVYVCFVCKYACAPLYAVSSGPKVLELELQPVVDLHVGSGNQTWVLGKSN